VPIVLLVRHIATSPLQHFIFFFKKLVDECDYYLNFQNKTWEKYELNDIWARMFTSLKLVMFVIL
jgi:hypothetical protein